MAKIKAFKATLPQPHWFNEILKNEEQGLFDLRYCLEARGSLKIDQRNRDEIILKLNQLMDEKLFENDLYQCIYLYGQQTGDKTTYGFCMLTDVADYEDQDIHKHEKTILEKQARLTDYREYIGIEGSPVLLIHRPDWRLNEIIADITLQSAPLIYDHAAQTHYIWRIIDVEIIEEITELFTRIGNVYIGDGHHRLASAAASKSITKPYINSLYVATNQLKISAFNRLVFPSEPLDKECFFQHIKKYFFVSPVPGNIPYKPDRLHRLGLCFKGEWYQLDVKPALMELVQLPDVIIIQDKILDELLGISDPQSAENLFYYPESAFAEMLEDGATSLDSIILTVFSLSMNKLMEMAEDGKFLPPKSSYIDPKIPFGLLMNIQALIARDDCVV